MYYELFNLLHTHLYGADVVLDEFQTLVLTELSTIGILFLAALPFLVVWLIIRVVFHA